MKNKRLKKLSNREIMARPARMDLWRELRSGAFDLHYMIDTLGSRQHSTRGAPSVEDLKKSLHKIGRSIDLRASKLALDILRGFKV